MGCLRSDVRPCSVVSLVRQRRILPQGPAQRRTVVRRCAAAPYTLLLKGAVYIHPTLAEGFRTLREEVKPVD